MMHNNKQQENLLLRGLLPKAKLMPKITIPITAFSLANLAHL